MVTYGDGQSMQVGDRVLLYHGKEPAEIEAIAESQEELKGLGLKVPCVVFRTEHFGMVSESIKSFDGFQEVLLVSRR